MRSTFRVKCLAWHSDRQPYQSMYTAIFLKCYHVNAQSRSLNRADLPLNETFGNFPGNYDFFQTHRFTPLSFSASFVAPLAYLLSDNALISPRNGHLDKSINYLNVVACSVYIFILIYLLHFSQNQPLLTILHILRHLSSHNLHNLPLIR